jgi:hypothetical protein
MRSRSSAGSSIGFLSIVLLPPLDRNDGAPACIALAAPQPESEINELIARLYPGRREHRRCEQLGVAADAFELDEIARPEILEPRCIQWYDSALPRWEHRENINEAGFVNSQRHEPERRGPARPAQKPIRRLSPRKNTFAYFSARARSGHEPAHVPRSRRRSGRHPLLLPSPAQTKPTPRRQRHKPPHWPRPTPPHPRTKLPPAAQPNRQHYAARPVSVTFFRLGQRPESETAAADEALRAEHGLAEEAPVSDNAASCHRVTHSVTVAMP